jgi:hypothetical protein
VVSSLNSFDGRIKADAVIVGAGAGGAVSLFATDATDVVVDITGYFVPPSVAGGLSFYPYEWFLSNNQSCNLVDTTGKAGPLGGPFLAKGTARSFPISTSPCLTGINGIQAYSLNITAAPHTTLGYLTVWNSDFAQPIVSTLNAPTGTVTSNAALIVAASGSISAFASDDTDLIVDINGFFGNAANVGQPGTSLFTMVPCRTLDTRVNGGKPVVGFGSVDVVSAGCVQSPPQAFVSNATVVPTTTLAFLDVFDPNGLNPVTDTLHALDAAVTSNMAITGTFGGDSIGYDASSPSAVILDVNGYFDFATLKVTTTSLPTGFNGIPYVAQMAAQGGEPPYMWGATGLPSWATINAKTGIITGNPTVGTSSPTFTVTDSVGATAAATLTLTINPLVGLQVNPQTLPPGKVGVLYQACVTATGGVTPYTWSIFTGSLPAGVTLGISAPVCGTTDAAYISGTPTAAGGNSFSLEVTDSQTKPATATAPFAITVAP